MKVLSSKLPCLLYLEADGTISHFVFQYKNLPQMENFTQLLRENFRFYEPDDNLCAVILSFKNFSHKKSDRVKVANLTKRLICKRWEVREAAVKKFRQVATEAQYSVLCPFFKNHILAIIRKFTSKMNVWFIQKN